jgi:acetylornithine/N-succinyldiaminopimelate aminotransferase
MSELVVSSAKKLKHVVDVRGSGLLLGIQLPESIVAGDFVSKCISHGLLLVSAANNTIRIVPPLIVSEEEVNAAMAVIEKVLNEMGSKV